MNRKEFQRRMRAALTEISRSGQMKLIGQSAADIIRRRTRLGYGAETEGGERAKLKPLSDSYKAFRAGKVAFATGKHKGNSWIYPLVPAKKPKLHAHTTANRSNLTFTGQMLDSVGVIKTSNGVATVGPKGTRKDGLTNAKVAGFNADQGRVFNNLTAVEKKQVAQIIDRELKKLIAKL